MQGKEAALAATVSREIPPRPDTHSAKSRAPVGPFASPSADPTSWPCAQATIAVAAEKERTAREGGTHQAPRAQEAARLWLLPSGPDQVHAAPLLGTRRTPPSRAVRKTGGEGGIRTPGNLLGCTRFPSELLKPLGHLSTQSACSHRVLRFGAPGRRMGSTLLASARARRNGADRNP